MGARSADSAFAVGAPATREPLTRLSFLSRKFTPHKALGNHRRDSTQENRHPSCTYHARLARLAGKEGWSARLPPTERYTFMSSRPPRAFTSFVWVAFTTLPLGSCHFTSTGTTTGKRLLPRGSSFVGGGSAAVAGACGKSVKSSYTVNSFWGAPDRCAGPATGGRPGPCLTSVECVQTPPTQSPATGRWAPLILQRQQGPTLAEVAGGRVGPSHRAVILGEVLPSALQNRDQLRQSVLVAEDRIESACLRYPVS